MLTEKSTERKSQPQMKKKGTALLAGFFPLYMHVKNPILNRTYISRDPARARVLVLAVALIELVAWISFDIVGSIRYGSELSGPGIVWLFIHYVIGISGVLFYKRSASATSARTGANAS